MGLVRSGLPEALVDELRRTFAVRSFVETGTYHAVTTEWAAARFERVVTVELAPELHARAVERLRPHRSRVEARHGDSRTVLREIVPTLDGPALFWLDAHWSGGETAGDASDCALLEEIQIIRSSPHEHYILIDDARLFTGPPPPPHNPGTWPSLRAVVSALTDGSDVEPMVVEDVLVVVPRHAEPVVVAYARDAAARALSARQLAVAGSMRHGLAQAAQGIRMAARGARARLRAAARPRGR
jgi:hypothetical protein